MKIDSTASPDFKVAACVAGGASCGYCGLEGDVQRASKLACQQGNIVLIEVQFFSP